MTDSVEPPVVPRVGPPWCLRGNGAILLHRFPPGFLTAGGFQPPGRFAGRLGLLILVDYQSSGVGPYRELLFLAGRFRKDGRPCFTIPRIWVSTEASLINGRENWGIPKELADFRIERIEQDGRREHAVVEARGRIIAELVLEARGPAFPVTAALLPRSWRTIVQLRQGRTWRTVVAGAGRVRAARVETVRSDPEVLPDLSRGRRLAAVWVEDLALELPVPEVK